MTEMIDRVAKAIFEAMDVTDGLDSSAAERYARAAIEAMREPTDAQITAFSRACDTNGQCLVKYGYNAMIDAALKA